jgi:hypothetical protein
MLNCYTAISGEVSSNETHKYQMMMMTVIGTRVANLSSGRFPVQGMSIRYTLKRKLDGPHAQNVYTACEWMNMGCTLLGPCTTTFSELLCVLLSSAPTILHIQWTIGRVTWLQEAVARGKTFGKLQRHYDRKICEADPSFSRHLSHVGLVVSPYFRRRSFRGQCAVNSLVTNLI